MPSFDVVSEIKKDELQNAIENANRELSTRYDFRGVDACFTLNKEDLTVKAQALEEFQIEQMKDILLNKLVKRGIEITCAEFKEITKSGKNSVQQIVFKEGIDKDLGKKIIKLIKDAKLKVDAKINDKTVRVTGKKKDDLQAAIALLKNAKLDQPLQYQNFRD